MIETLALVLLRQRLPIELGSLQQAQGTHNIGTGKGKGILDGTVNVRLGCQVNDTVDLLVLHKLVEGIKIADVHPDKLIVRLILNILEVCQITRIGQFIQVDDVVLGILVDKESYNVGADEACTTSDNDIFHDFIIIFVIQH